MKKYFVLTLLISTSAFANCPGKVNPQKVMLFVDTNNSELEIITAQKAACARGETLKIVPKNYLAFGAYSKKVEAASKKVQAAKCSNPEDAKCKPLMQEWMKAYEEMNTFRSTQKPTGTQVKEALDEVKKANGKLQHVAISGHDGGGHFSGNKGNFGRTELAQLMSQYGDINEVKSLLLLGCYTGTQHEVMAWKSIFPQTKLIGGYDGSAPLADRPQGHQYIMDILTKEKQLTKQADEKKLQSYVDANVKGLGNLNAGIYVQCSDGTSEQSYYYGSKKQRKFEKVQVDECVSKAGELRQVAEAYAKYESGELAVPADTSGGALRDLYNKARTYEHCADITGVFINVNGIFNMLFYEGVKQNFAQFHKDDLLEVEKFLNFDPAEMEKTLNDSLKQTEDYIAKQEADLKFKKENPQQYLEKQEKELAELKAAAEKILNDPANADVKKFFNDNGEMISMPNSLSEEQMKKLGAIQMASIAYNSKKYSHEYEKSNLSQTFAMEEMQIQGMKKMMNDQRVSFQDLKKEISDPNNKIWSPTAENLKKYSRADLLKNIHRMNKVMSLPVLKDEERKAISWLAGTTARHLQMFNNPFEWHEFTGNPHKPENSFRLKDAVSGNMGMTGGMSGGYPGGFGGGFGTMNPYQSQGMYMGGGYGGGYGMMGPMGGGMYGGGMVGGSQGGATSGSNGGSTQTQQPQQQN